MASNNDLTLAVAGSRKTQRVIETCGSANPDERILILTYTTQNQAELRQRLSSLFGHRPNVEILGWFSFLIGHFVRPFVPYEFPNTRVRGFDFESEPQQGTKVTDRRRYFTREHQVRKVHLPQLAVRVNSASGGLAVKRLEQLYDHVFIDEVQDLCGYDLEILKLLMESDLPLSMVGDVRQATLATNPREQKNARYRYMQIWHWFQIAKQEGLLTVTQSNETYRCRQEIATLADSLFPAKWGFESTVSHNSLITGHDGIFLVRTEDVPNYMELYRPLPLRVRQTVGVDLSLPFMNFGEAKGLGRERVLILPTRPIRRFLNRGEPLTDGQASALYVAITRAMQSVAFIVDDVDGYGIPVWSPVTS